MGKQLRFYMSYEDELFFIQTLREKDSVYLIFNRFEDKLRMKFDELHPIDTTNKIKSVNMDYNLSLAHVLYSTKINYRFIENQNYFILNFTDSEVIQFYRSQYSTENKKKLFGGHLWFETVCYDRESTPKIYYKSEEFIKWANSVLRWIKTHYHKHKEKSGGMVYIGPYAYELIKAGKVLIC